VEILASIIRSEARPQFSAVADRPMDRAWRADPRPAAELLDWRTCTALEDGLRKTVAWYADNLTSASSRSIAQVSDVVR
jgi:UDP-glucose 4-epimerase